VPSLYSADDALLQRLSDYVKNGGHVLMTFKSGFTNENSAVRWQKAPGPLTAAAGFTYQEFSNLEKPLQLKGDPFAVGEGNRVSEWAEFLQPTTAKPLATYDHPFFGRWAAITENSYGKGGLVYEGTALTPELQQAVVQHALGSSGISFDAKASASSVRVKRGVSGDGRELTYLLNYSSSPSSVSYTGRPAHDVLTGIALATGQVVQLKPWDLVIAESEKAGK
ncbi:MAG: beta-galactosidase trimerization domain-containing protein, partial [Janthinobacterium lividum]